MKVGNQTLGDSAVISLKTGGFFCTGSRLRSESSNPSKQLAKPLRKVEFLLVSGDIRSLAKPGGETAGGYFVAAAICGLIGRITGISPSPTAANAAQ